MGFVAQDDFLVDDTALVHQSDMGLVVITGCSHSGICNIIEQAMRITGDDRIVDVIGGFHLLNPSPAQLEGTIAYMEDIQPSQLHACHCTGMRAKNALARVANLQETGSGLILEYA